VRGEAISKPLTPSDRTGGPGKWLSQFKTSQYGTLRLVGPPSIPQEFPQSALLPLRGEGAYSREGCPSKTSVELCFAMLTGNSHGTHEREMSLQYRPGKIRAAPKNAELSPSTRSPGASFPHL
jgi:hypothetical protein